MAQEGVTEKRRHKRFKVTPKVFVEFSSSLPHIGQIIDISIGGIAFRYIERDGAIACSQIKIYNISGNGFFLENLRVKTISDIRIPSHLGPSVIRIRRQGVQFQKLSAENMESLEYLIERYTIGEA